MDDDAHRALAELVHGVQGLVVISGYPSALYAELYERHGWARVEKLARTNGRSRRRECLWLSPRAQSALSSPSLFDGEAR